jgi:acyl transferase domain-containing protein
VRFADGLATLIDKHAFLLFECGPGTSLSQAARAISAGRKDVNAIPLLSPEHTTLNGLTSLLRIQEQRWCYGQVIPHSSHGNKIPLPTYRFDRARHWVDPEPQTACAASAICAVDNETTPEQAQPVNTLAEKLTLLWCEALGSRILSRMKTSSTSVVIPSSASRLLTVHGRLGCILVLVTSLNFRRWKA